MLRPKIALADAAEAIRSNWDFVQESEIFTESTINILTTLIPPIYQRLVNVDSKPKDTGSTEQQIYDVMTTCFAKPQSEE